MSFLRDLFGLDGKTALVTGGASGLGRIVAEALALAGARVVISARRAEDGLAAADAIMERVREARSDGLAELVVGDLSTAAGVEALAAEARLKAETLNILVNNAGVSWSGPLESFPYEAWEKVMRVNVTGLFDFTRTLLPKLEAAATDADPARIVNIGAAVGLRPIGDRAYSHGASKAAVHHLTGVLANELASRRITCNALAPGVFPTRLTAMATADAESAARTAEATPLGRLGEPQDLAAAALYLCGRGGAYVTGAVLPVDGGVSAIAPTSLSPR